MDGKFVIGTRECEAGFFATLFEAQKAEDVADEVGEAHVGRQCNARKLSWASDPGPSVLSLLLIL
jgi:hypothetical protein